jgi:polysaccharide pyruvyl transferase CsaB
LSIKIALSGYYGFDNAGDEALLAAITSSIKKLEPESEFVVFSGSPSRTIDLHGIRAVNYINPFSLLRELMSVDLLISGGGSIFQDVTSTRSLSYYIGVVALARLLRRPVIFYAQGVGPINRNFSKLLMRLVANRVNLITLRDHDSRQYMEQLKVTHPPLIVTADPVFALEPGPVDEDNINKLLADTFTEDKPLVGVSVRKWKYLQGYQDKLARLLDELSLRGYQVVFIPMAYPDDINESKLVAGLMRQDAKIIEKNLNSTEHLALISHLNLMIGMRLHALIFAASRGVPFAGISYDPKIDSFLGLFNLKPLSLEFSEMKNQVDRILDDVNFQTALRQKSIEMRAKSEDNARLALSLIKNHGHYSPL